MRYAIVPILAVFLSGCVIVGGGHHDPVCEATRDVNASLEASGIETVVVEAKAGSLTIRASEEAGEIRAWGTACADGPKTLSEVRLETRREGDTAYIIVEMPKSKGWGRNRDYAELDLEVSLPTGARLEVADSSGSVVVEGVAGLELVDSSGSIEIRDIDGDLRVKDSSGGMLITGVRGDVWIRDSSGGIEVDDVEGGVTIEADSSGGIDISSVRGSVTVGSDSSGGISVRDIGGDFVVRADGSGGISHSNVGGTVSIPD